MNGKRLNTFTFLHFIYLGLSIRYPPVNSFMPFMI